MLNTLRPLTLFFFQIGLLGALGIRATLITDGKTPVNLYQAPNGAITPLGGQH